MLFMKHEFLVFLVNTPWQAIPHNDLKLLSDEQKKIETGQAAQKIQTSFTRFDNKQKSQENCSCCTGMRTKYRLYWEFYFFLY